MTALQLFERLGPLVGPVLEREYDRRDLCIFATRVVIDVAGYFGIEARPLPVRAIVFNEAFAAHTAEDDFDVKKWRSVDGSYSVGIGFGHTAGKWSGHLIAEADGVFGDFSIRQAERLQHSIHTGNAVVAPLPESDAWTVSGNGAIIEYSRIEDESFRRAPDWKVRDRRRAIVGALIRIVRHEAFTT